MKSQRARFFLLAVLILLVFCLPGFSTIPVESEMPLAGSVPNQRVNRVNPHLASLDTKAPLTGTWSPLTSGTANNLFSVHFVNDSEGWAVGFSNTILHTTNGGGTWTAQTNQSGVIPSSYLGVRFLDSSIGWAGGGAEVVRTTDGGASWTPQGATQDGRFRNNLFAVSSTAAWIPARTSTLTARWFSRFTVGVGEQNFNVLGGSSEYFDIYFTDIDNGWSVGTGPIVRITNGSSASPSFSFQTSCPCPNLNGIHMLDSITGWAVGNGGLILKTTDGGSTWPAQTSGTTTNLRSVHFVDANTGWAVGNGGLILASTDGGATWAPETSGVTADLRRVFFVNANTGYVVGHNGTILKRTTAPQPMTFVVTNTNDSGAGSLRQAIADADANTEDDTIIFNIPTSDPNFDGSTFLIRPTTGEYTLTDDGTFIDGASQTAFTGNTNASGPEIVIDGSACPTSDCDGFTVQSSNNRIHGLVINQMFGSGIKLEAGAIGNTITGCYIGTNPSGTASSIFFDGDGIASAGGNIIGGLNPGDGNLISSCGTGSSFGGLVLGSNDQVRGNKIGTNAAGTESIPNSSNGIKVAGSNVVIENNLISGGNGVGIFLTGAGTTSNTIRGNKIGTDTTGTLDVGNAANGIWIDGATNNTIGGTTAADRNIISGNNQNGIRISGSTATGNFVRGNYIGTDVTGTVALGNNFSGVNITLNAPGNTIGGTTASARNIISGNSDTGISIGGSTATGNMVQGNYIGTDVTGTAALGNQTGVGVFGFNDTIGGAAAGAGNLISGNQLGMETNNGTGNLIQGNLIGTNAAGTAALGNTFDGIICGSSNNTIGGLAAGERNIISGNGRHGVMIRNTGGPTPPPSGNQVIGNYIGTDITGAIDLGNAQDGVHIIEGVSNTIGGTSIAARNVISGNNQNGVNINSNTTNDNTVQGNLIGLQADGVTAMPNSQAGVLLPGPGVPRNNTIGGAAAGAGNVIAHNGAGGVVISYTTSIPGIGNPVLRNSIFSNIGLGIDLGPAGVTPNDPIDADTGANNLQNFPVVTSSTTDGTQVNIQGTLNSTASATFDLDFFVNSSCDDSGNGEGQTYIGSASVNTNGSGNVTFNVTLTASVSTAERITATATGASGNTSEFSSCSSPTVIELASFTATSYDEGVFIEWQTGFESDNLGFNIYREEAGERSRVNQQLVAGSALMAGSTLRAGQAYAWSDNCGSRRADCKNALYWLEDIDLGGRSTWHGPFFPKQAGGRPPGKSRAAFLSEVANNEAYSRSSRAIERTAPISRPSSEDVAFQTLLASREAVKIYVKHEGWYRVSQKELVAAGLDPDVAPRLLRLFAEGKEQPIIVSTGKEERFDESSSIEFYGIGLDTAATDEHVYWLVADRQDGLRVQQVKGEGAPSSSRSFTQTIERKDRTIYFAALRNGERENFFGAVVSSGGVDQELALPHLDQASDQQASIEVALQGVTLLPHRVAVHLNSSLIGEVAFDGQRQGIARLRVPHSMLNDGSNMIRLIAHGGASDVSLVDSIRVSYQHTFTADDDQLKLAAKAGEQVTIKGFTSPNIRVFDVSNRQNVEELLGEIKNQKDGYVINVAAPASAGRRLLALASEAVKQPASIKANKPSQWRSSDHAADLIIIAREEFFPALEGLKTAREDESYKVALVDIEDVYDEFNFGEKSPQALKDFLSFATANWKVAPRFLLLAGDASYDTRNYLGLGDADLVPTKLTDTAYMETASDDWFVDFDSDGLAELSVGRLPARSPDEAWNMVEKTLAYSKSPPMNEALLVADSNEGFNFEAASAQLRQLIPPGIRVRQINRGRVDPAAAKQQLKEAIARGQKVINYVGHGSANTWNGGLLRAEEAKELTNAGRLPLFVMMTCLNGYFHDAAADSLAEWLLKAERGGAVAVWASTGLTLPAEQAIINSELYRLLFQQGKDAITLGEATRRAKSAVSNRDIHRTWMLLGDPTVKLR